MKKLNQDCAKEHDAVVGAKMMTKSDFHYYAFSTARLFNSFNSYFNALQFVGKCVSAQKAEQFIEIIVYALRLRDR